MSRRLVWWLIAYAGVLLVAAAIGGVVAYVASSQVISKTGVIVPVSTTPAGTPPAGYEEETSETQ